MVIPKCARTSGRCHAVRIASLVRIGYAAHTGWMVVQIREQALLDVLSTAIEAVPHEACGLLLGTALHIELAVPTANVAPDPARHFEIDPVALIAAYKDTRRGGQQVVGYFHSHPNGLARPSATDAAMAARDGRIWVIAAPVNDGPWGITCWHDGIEGFEPLSYAVMAG